MDSADQQEASKADLLRKFNEESRKQAAEHNERLRKYKETPLEHDYAQQPPGAPHLSVHISGPPTLSLSAKHYILDAHLHYHANSGTQSITIRNGGVPGSGWNDDERYLFYKDDGTSVAEGTAVKHEFPDKNIDDSKVPVQTENGFSSMRPGDTVSWQVCIWLRWWFGLEVGGRYKLLMPHGYIGWWEFGPLKSHKELQIAPSDILEDGILRIPRSNSIDIEVVA